MATTTKKLMRLPEQGQIAGVCAGLAQYFDIDVTLLRVVFVLLAIATGGGFVVAYLLMALIMPSDKDKAVEKTSAKALEHNAQTLAAEMRGTDRGNRVRNYFGIGLIALGVWLLLESVFPGWFDLRWDYVWPVALIIIGLFIATRRNG